MPGYPDQAKRSAVRKLLLKAKWQRESNRAIAAEAGVSRLTVNTVRREMILSGEHPPIESIEPARPIRRPELRPGSAVRGGMVYNAEGKPVSELKYILGEARSRNRQLARLLTEAITILREPRPAKKK